MAARRPRLRTVYSRAWSGTTEGGGGELLQGGARYVGAALPSDSVIALQGSALFTARYWEQLRPWAR